MGMYDTLYAELDCPFCGHAFRHTPMTWEAAEAKVREHKQFQIEERQRELGGKSSFRLQPSWAERDGFENIDAWIAQLDRPELIEAYRTRRILGLADIQTKAFECSLAEYYVGDEAPAYIGHYYIPEEFDCPGCSNEHETVCVRAWIEVQDRRIKAVLTRNPETGQAEKIKYPMRAERTSEEEGPQ